MKITRLMGLGIVLILAGLVISHALVVVGVVLVAVGWYFKK